MIVVMNSPAPSYRLVDADTHVNEPPDLWTSRVSAAMRDRVPHLQRFEEGDAWVAEGVKDPINFGLNAAATFSRFDRKAWVRFEDISPGGYDPAHRLAEMDADVVDAAVFYPTPRLSQIVISQRDPAFHLLMVQAYNDWLIEYCAHDPARLGAIILLPNRGVEQAVAEIQRVAGRPGVVGALIGLFPHGDRDLSTADDAVWHALVAAGLPAHIHVKLVDEPPEDVYSPDKITAGRAASDLRFLDAPTIMVQFLNSGVFDRVPGLDMVMAEVDAGWVPYVKEQLDNRFRRRATARDTRFKPLPSEIIRRHFHFTYLTDHYAVINRHHIGVDRLMWSSDFPHSGSDWPNSWRTIDSDYATIPREERDQILAGNALGLYKFDAR
jgi:predicted TIM-barrel fold metal-dependent hydrolase